MQHDIDLKELKFDLLTPRVGGLGSESKIFTTELLHLRFSFLIWYATWPCSEKVEFDLLTQSPGEGGGEGVCSQNICYRVAAFRDSLYLICNNDQVLKKLELWPGHTFMDHLAGSTTDQILRMTSEMIISVVRYGCTMQVILRMITDAIRKYTD